MEKVHPPILDVDEEDAVIRDGDDLDFTGLSEAMTRSRFVKAYQLGGSSFFRRSNPLTGGRNWARFASLIGTCKMNRVEPYAYLRDLFISLANGHLAKDIDALMPWAMRNGSAPHNELVRHSSMSS